MANCKSCLNSECEKDGKLICKLPDAGIAIIPDGEHELTCFEYEPGTLDEPAKTEW